MKPIVDLVCWGEAENFDWTLGSVIKAEHSIQSLIKCAQVLCTRSSTSAILFWGCSATTPNVEYIERVLSEERDDVWHGGLCLGMRGLPSILDCISPGWLFNADGPEVCESTSWRVSLEACLIRVGVLRNLAFLDPDFCSVEAAALEWGHRILQLGVFVRNTPWLWTVQPRTSFPPKITRQMTFADELLFASKRFGRKWARWGLLRAALSRKIGVGEFIKRSLSFLKTSPACCRTPYRSTSVVASSSIVYPIPGVSVLIPTVDRYPYLRVLLDQLRKQTIRPLEIIVVDQTDVRIRDLNLVSDFTDLPLRLITQEEPGQCSSRNVGLKVAQGEFILFIDDDDEIEPDLIEKHLRSIAEWNADSSSGIVEEAGSDNVAPSVCVRYSDVFPTNNTLVARRALVKSGLFDLAYNRGQRADGDLGMRIYLSGAKMVLNSGIVLFHHHAPSGGLRKHKARVITYSSSRTRMLHRNLPSATEFYLAYRYFGERQATETAWLRVLGTFSIRGGALRKAGKVIVSLILLPHTLLIVRRNMNEGRKFLKKFPIIPQLHPAPEAPDVKCISCT